MSSLIMNRSSLGQWCCSKQSTCFIILNICVTSIFFLQYVLHSNGDARDNLLLTNYTNDSHRHLKANKKVLEPRDYTYIIIHYHKTGHDLTRSIVDMISGGIQGISKPTVWTRRTMLSTFNKDTRCPNKLEFQEGIYVMTAPNFFCDTETLVELLLKEQEGSFLQRNKNKPRRGYKIIHLVRNPYSLAVSNYNYHSQNPTPESWVHRSNPCEEEKLRGHLYPDLLLPVLSPIMNENDFRELYERCNFLFQNPDRPQLQNQYLYKHLSELDPSLGVQLSTLHMMTQVVTGGDITRMASNIVKLNDLKHSVARSNALHHLATGNPNDELIQVMSLSTDDFIVDPNGMARRFIDFCFGNTVSDEIKTGIAQHYEQSYMDLKSGSHVTHTSGNTDVLKEALRADTLFGRVLCNLENVVEQALAESRG